MKTRILAVIAASLACAACQTAQQRPLGVTIGAAKALTTPGDIRLVTERDPPAKSGRVLCAEPSPDVAVALSSAFKASGGVETPTGRQVGVGVGGSTAESLGLLAGRTASIVALRDGLYRACEAYGNNVLPRDVYGLIVSQYGDILVTLTLGEAAAGTARSPAMLMAPAAAIDVNAAPPAFVAIPAKPAAAAPAAPAAASPSSTTSSSTTSSTGGAASAANSAADAAADAADTSADKKPDPPAADPPAPGAAAQGDDVAPGVGAAAAVADVAKAYFGAADARSLHSVVTVCIMEAESRSPNRANRDFIDGICEGYLTKMAPALAQKAGYAADQVRYAADKAHFEAQQEFYKAELLRLQVDKAVTDAAKPKPKPAQRR